MISAVIVDDEPKNLKILFRLIEEFCPDVQILGTAERIDPAIELIRQKKPELLFLDIAMPGGTAFSLLDQLQPIDFEVIFVSAYDTYTLTAFKYSAVDYLLKPVIIEELQAAVDRAILRKKQKQNNLQHLGSLLNHLNKQSNSIRKIAIPTADGIVFLDVGDIVRCEASGAYTHIYSTDKKKLIVSRRMNEYEDMLPANQFMRVHHSHIINLDHVTRYHRGRGGVIEMSDGAMLELATRRKDEFLARFGLKS